MRSRRCLIIILLAFLVFFAASSNAAEFSFFSTMRAGIPGNGDWEIGVGTDSAASQSTGSFQWSNSNPTWRDGNQPQHFQIGFTASTQSAYITVWDSTNTPLTRQITNTGTALTPTAIWTFPSANFFVNVASPPGAQARSITVENLTISPGVQVLSGSLPSSLGASGPPAATNSLAAPLVLNPSGNGGNWFIDGNVRFSGVTTIGGNAQRSQLQFFLNAKGTDTPEVQSVLQVGVGLFLSGLAGRAWSSSKA